jgi:hypothetical protein
MSSFGLIEENIELSHIHLAVKVEINKFVTGANVQVRQSDDNRLSCT